MKIINNGDAIALPLSTGATIFLPSKNSVSVPDNTFLVPSDKALLLAQNVTITNDAGGAFTFPSVPSAGGPVVNATLADVALIKPNKIRGRGCRAYGMQYQTAASPTFDGRTWHLGMVSEVPYAAIRVKVRNAEATGYTLNSVSVAASALINSATPTTGIWLPVTWSGVTSVAVPARIAAGRPSVINSDVILLDSIPGSDTPFYPMHARAYINTGPFSVSGGNTILTALSPSNNNPTTNGRFVVSLYKAGGDYASTNQANFTGATATNLSPCLEIEFLTAGEVATVMGIGDSIMFGSSGVAALTSYAYQACAGLSNSQKAVYFQNYAVPSTTTAQFLQRLQDVMAEGERPNILLYSPFSPNDGTPDQFNTAASVNRLVQVADICRLNDIRLCVVNGMPNTAAAWDTTADGYWKACNKKIALVGAAYGFPVIDAASLLSDGATPARYIAAYTTDGTHPNDAGHSVLVPATKVAIQSIL